MKKVLTVIVSLFTLSFTIAQTSVKGLGTSDPDAKKILDEVSSKFKDYSSVKASFALKIENSAGKVRGTKKGVAYMKGNQYKVELTDQEIFLRWKKRVDL